MDVVAVVIMSFILQGCILGLQGEPLKKEGIERWR